MFDIDGNGIADPGEEYLAFRIWEEMNGIDEDGMPGETGGEENTRQGG